MCSKMYNIKLSHSGYAWWLGDQEKCAHKTSNK